METENDMDKLWIWIDNSSLYFGYHRHHVATTVFVLLEMGYFHYCRHFIVLYLLFFSQIFIVLYLLFFSQWNLWIQTTETWPVK